MKELSLLVLAKREGKRVEKHSQRKKEKRRKKKTEQRSTKGDMTRASTIKELPRILRNLYHAGAVMEESESNS
jgi:hypothetical protein